MTVNKRTIHDLALLGGSPAFAEPLHVGLPNVGNQQRFLARVQDILGRRWLTNDGRFVQELEQRLADLLGVEHCILVSSGTAGLAVACRALGLEGEVIVPSFTFVATPHALQWLGLEPVFADVDRETHNLDPEAVAALVTPRTSAIVGTHLWGQPCAVPELAAIARRHELSLLYDAAHAFHCTYRGGMIGNFGHAEVFSFHATKFFNTLEGGAITTNDAEIAATARLMRNHGFAGPDRVVSLGINAKMNEVSAAMGLTLLESLPELLAGNRHSYEQYASALAGVPGLRLLPYPEPADNNCQYVVIEVDDEVIERDLLYAALNRENVLARRYFYPGCHHLEPYRSQRAPESWSLPATEWLAARVLCLPAGATLTAESIAGVAGLIRFIMEQGAALRDTAPDILPAAPIGA